MSAGRLPAGLTAAPGLADAAVSEGPVFAAPWQAQAFALAVRLHEAGHFTWGEWAAALGAAIAAEGQGDGRSSSLDADVTGEAYWLAWLSALETLVAAKGLASCPALEERRAAWDRAARATPHGEPIVLGREATGA